MLDQLDHLYVLLKIVMGCVTKKNYNIERK